ncbi:MAG: Rho termination factor N-terminal domain-containing protein, partial [Pseudonocardiaceae bacterium]
MAVLQRTELESSPLADLHAIASELGLEGFRSKRKDDLIGVILAAQGGEEAEPEEAAAVDEPEPDEVPAEEALDAGPEPPVD